MLENIVRKGEIACYMIILRVIEPHSDERGHNASCDP